LKSPIHAQIAASPLKKNQSRKKIPDARGIMTKPDDSDDFGLADDFEPDDAEE
jgi:hypothetical protein